VQRPRPWNSPFTAEQRTYLPSCRSARLLLAKLTDAKLDGTDLAGTIMPDGTAHE
jgi:hypothetical protein